MPIWQWMYFDAIECLPENAMEELTEAACQPVCSYHLRLLQLPSEKRFTMRTCNSLLCYGTLEMVLLLLFFIHYI